MALGLAMPAWADSTTANVSAPPPGPSPASAGTLAISVSAAETMHDKDNVDAQAIGRLVAEIEMALRGNDVPRAEAALERLGALLPAQSLTLLRMQAWHAHQGGDLTTAIARYAEIVQRVPGDRNAAINLALLEAAQGDADRAAQRLRSLRWASGDSAELASAMAQVGAMPR